MTDTATFDALLCIAASLNRIADNLDGLRTTLETPVRRDA